jgi:hypothetical protein
MAIWPEREDIGELRSVLKKPLLLQPDEQDGLSALNRARVICREGTSRENGTARIRLPKPSRCAW